MRISRLAALINPAGEVVSRLPDRRPGSLVVDIPVEMILEPVRPAARALVVDERGSALLVKFREHRTQSLVVVVRPGGGLDPGEPHADALRRELREELGRRNLELGYGSARTHTFAIGDRWMTQRESWVLCRANTFMPDSARTASLESETVYDARWWRADEIRSSGIVTAPSGLADILDAVNAGLVFESNTDLGSHPH